MAVVTPSIDDLLAPGGPVSRELGADFEPRAEQRSMAHAVSNALDTRSHLLVEAGTGVGKSFAYLLPAVRRIIESEGHERVVIATNTIALQEQLLKRDVPLLQRVFEGIAPPRTSVEGEPLPAFSAELVKGRGNYLSLRRLELASRREDRLFPDEASRESLHQIEQWAYDTTDGTLATLPQLDRAGVWDRVQSDSGNCMGRKCPRYQACFFQTARRRMERASLLICNHALFFSDLALRRAGVGFLPDYHHVILDEAHGVEDVASEHFGVTLSESRIKHLLGMLFNPARGRGFLATMKPSGDGGTPDDAVRCTLDAEEASRRFFEEVIRFTSGRPGTSRLPPIAPGGEPLIRNDITPAFKSLALALKRLKDSAAADEDKFELNSYIDRAQSVAEQAEILSDQQYDGFVYWAETTSAARGLGVRASLACAPIEVAPILSTHLFAGETSVILTSATLTTGKTSFAHAQSRLGCPSATTLALGSPFDHAAQSELHADASMPDPHAPNYIDELADRIVSHVNATDGGAFVLFTSFDTLHKAARIARPSLERAGHPVLVHGQDGSREHILTEFRKDERSVLFGTSSFWQGVDVRGRGLRNVIITRLPFDPPDRPLTQARLELIQARGGNPFMEDSLPRAIIRFKQGFGRLIRSQSDHGRVVVLDPRLLTARYGRLFLDALPEGVRIIRTGITDDHAPF